MTNLRLSAALYRLSYSRVSPTEWTRTIDLFINSEVRLVYRTWHHYEVMSDARG